MRSTNPYMLQEELPKFESITPEASKEVPPCLSTAYTPSEVSPVRQPFVVLPSPWLVRYVPAGVRAWLPQATIDEYAPLWTSSSNTTVDSTLEVALYMRYVLVIFTYCSPEMLSSRLASTRLVSSHVMSCHRSTFADGRCDTPDVALFWREPSRDAEVAHIEYRSSNHGGALARVTVPLSQNKYYPLLYDWSVDSGRSTEKLKGQASNRTSPTSCSSCIATFIPGVRFCPVSTTPLPRVSRPTLVRCVLVFFPYAGVRRFARGPEDRVCQVRGGPGRLHIQRFLGEQGERGKGSFIACGP